ncbi:MULTISPECIES: EAL domain-containing protein [unclassified Leptolyngbya]|uniref:EAL domain-containing protein n=1 Tax=unclassified Leptolyngbya TaxID=2650499 RepID=UPI0016828B15|nr:MULTISPECIES: EAL domain-containing protein [unclassified Leptolyngbya]MBD1910500.1 EAL domain-containing protein [Leptolyngbya sp. FACHB-8]MBD2153667.1 EAL domain-containing protein [Leptolyngbya sp. FACHB-16]
MAGLLALLLMLGLLQLGIGDSLENLTYDTLFQLRGSVPWSSDVVVVEIDESRTSTEGQFMGSRDRLVGLLNILAQGKPSVVVLDLLLSESTPSDGELAKAMGQFNRMVLAQSWDETGAQIPPTSKLREAAWAIGHTEQQRELDGLVRKIPLKRNGLPALSVVAMSAHQGDRSLQLPDRLNRPLWINWAGPADMAPHYSLLDILSGKVSPEVFANRIVVLGLTTPTLDALQTPFDRDPPTSGVYLQAAAIGNLLQNDDLKRLGAGWIVLILLLGGPGLSCLVSRWRVERLLSFWAALCLSWGLLGIFLFHWDYWIPIAMPLLLLTLTTAVVTLKEQLRVNSLLRQSEERYALAVQGSNGGLWDWNLQTNTIFFSQRWKEMLGEEGDGVDDRPESWYERVHPDDLAPLQASIQDYLEGRRSEFENEHRLRHRDGSYRWMLCRGVVVRDRHGNPYRMAGSQLDITARKAVEEQLWRSAYYDDLTGLPNRAFFLDRLKRAIVAAEKNALYVYAVLLMDVDRFQVVNNSLGNDIGDQLLVAIARRLKGFFNLESVIARRSGDEFIVLLENVEHPGDATRTAEQIQQILSLPFHLDEHEVYITVSIGIAISSTRHKNPEHLLQDADTAMYRAKAKGKARCQVFDPDMHSRMLARLKLENDLRRAISHEHRWVEDLEEEGNQHQELMLYYQPIVNLATSRILGFESLARWHHPTMGFLPPSRFITMAEETGLIIPLGWWILRQSCRQMQVWKNQYPDLPPLTISVNLASRQFSLPNLTHEIQSILEETGLPPSCLKLEITEGTIMDTGQGVINVLNQLRSLGIQLSIDDFGTGYSSLSYLSRFPINTLKIDRSFVSKMDLGQDSAEIVRTIVTLAHNLGMDVTAEGVETEEQRRYLLEMACESGQGYYFAKPLDTDTVSELLQQCSPLDCSVQRQSKG